MPPESLSMLAVIKPGPSTVRKSSIRIRQRLSIGQSEEFNLNSLTAYSKAEIFNVWIARMQLHDPPVLPPPAGLSYRLQAGRAGCTCRTVRRLHPDALPLDWR